jgi:putative chitinase
MTSVNRLDPALAFLRPNAGERASLEHGRVGADVAGKEATGSTSTAAGPAAAAAADLAGPEAQGPIVPGREALLERANAARAARVGAEDASRGALEAGADRREAVREPVRGLSRSSTPATTPDSPLLTTAGDEIAQRNGFSAADVLEVLRGLGYEQPALADALRQFQADAGLPMTGDLDLETLMAMLGAALSRDRRSRAQPQSSPHGGVHAGRPNSTEAGYAGGVGGAGGVSDVGRPIGQTAPVDAANWSPGAGDVTPQQLQAIVPSLSGAKAAEVAPHLNRAMAEAGIDSPARKAAFISQVAHESGGFKYNEEIASGRAYEGRRDLGNTQPGDGERFKGRGYIQLTGRANYAAAGKALGLDLVNNPELAAKPENAARVAAWYWNSRGLNGLADRGDFDGITKRINGGFNGKADRDQYHARAQRVLKDSVGLPATGRFVAPEGTATNGAPAGAPGKVDANHPQLRALATGRLVGARTGLCVTATLDNMQRNGVAQPAATGNDVGNNPRGGMVQMMRDFGWKSLPGVGAPQTINSPYGTVQANVIPAAQYEQMARAGQIPSGAVVFQTRHPSWNMTSPGSRGFDMGIARDGGRTLFNFADMGGPMVYPDTKSVVVLVPGGAVR